MANVYFIPSLRSNIINLGQETEAGCDIRIRDDYLTLHEKDGNLITKAKRSKNCLYKVIIEIVDTKCLQLISQDDSTIWYARLRLIGKKNVKDNGEKVTGYWHAKYNSWKRNMYVMHAWQTSKTPLSVSKLLQCHRDSKPRTR